ncbi:hypothetical protein Tco_0848518 [Tanacetum coccineum]
MEGNDACNVLNNSLAHNPKNPRSTSASYHLNNSTSTAKSAHPKISRSTATSPHDTSSHPKNPTSGTRPKNSSPSLQSYSYNKYAFGKIHKLRDVKFIDDNNNNNLDVAATFSITSQASGLWSIDLMSFMGQKNKDEDEDENDDAKSSENVESSYENEVV